VFRKAIPDSSASIFQPLLRVVAIRRNRVTLRAVKIIFIADILSLSLSFSRERENDRLRQIWTVAE